MIAACFNGALSDAACVWHVAHHIHGRAAVLQARPSLAFLEEALLEVGRRISSPDLFFALYLE